MPADSEVTDRLDPAEAVDLRPPIYRERQYLTVAIVMALIAVYFHIGDSLPVPGTFGKVDLRSGQTFFNNWLFLSTAVVGFYFVFGVAGRFAFSTAALIGLGAYTAAYYNRNGPSWIVGFVAAIVVCSIIGFLFALLMRRAHHFYFAVATLGLSEIVLLVFRRWERLTGRPGGEINSPGDISVFGFTFDSRYRFFWLWFVLLTAVLLIGVLIERSPLKRHAIAGRDKETVAETNGIATHRLGIVMFTLGSAIAGAAGAIWIHTSAGAEPNEFGVELGIGIFVILILGGMHSMWGALVGAWFWVYVPEYLERWEQWTQVIWGVVLLIVMIAFPDGLIGLVRRIGRALRGESTAGETRAARRSLLARITGG